MNDKLEWTVCCSIWLASYRFYFLRTPSIHIMWREKKNNRNNIKTKKKDFMNRLCMITNCLCYIKCNRSFLCYVLGHILYTRKKQEKNTSNLKVGIGNYEKELLWDVSWSQRTFGRWWSHCFEMRIGIKENIFQRGNRKNDILFFCLYCNVYNTNTIC